MNADDLGDPLLFIQQVKAFIWLVEYLKILMNWLHEVDIRALKMS